MTRTELASRAAANAASAAARVGHWKYTAPGTPTTNGAVLDLRGSASVDVEW